MATTTPAIAPLPIWPTIRTGLRVVRSEAAALVTIAIFAIFLAAGAVASLDAFTKHTLALPLDPRIESLLVFSGSTLIASLAGVPLAVQTLETPPTKHFESLLDRTWRAARVRLHALSFRLFLRSAGVVLLANAGALCCLLPSLILVATGTGLGIFAGAVSVSLLLPSPRGWH